MNLQQIAQQVKDLIVQGELDEGATLLVNFFNQEYLSQADKAQFQLYNQALHQLSQLNELKHQVLTGVISSEDADLKRNKVRSALLEIAEELKKLETALNPTEPIPIARTVPPPKPATNKRLLFVLSGLLAVALLVWVIKKVNGRNEPAMTGCYIKTGMLTDLVMEPKLSASKIGTLPNFKTYQVLAIVPYQHVHEILFFKVNDKKLGVGWVQEGILLEYTSPECLRKKEEKSTPGLINSANENPQNQLPPAPPEQQFTGCYVKTSMMTELLNRPEMLGARIMELPERKKYQVLDTRNINFAGQAIYFFKIQEGGHTGWVRQVQLEFISPACLN